MDKSPETKDLDEAISLVQQELKRAHKDKKNPHLKNEYASLESIIDTLRPITAKHGISIQQFPEFEGTIYVLRTRVAHKSGQYIVTSMPLLMAIVDMQKFGSAITYARRYSLSSIFCLATGEDDDDGEACVSKAAIIEKKEIKESKPIVKSQAGISKAQISAIEHIVTESGRDLGKILAYYKVNTLETLSHEQGVEILNTLKKGA